MVVYIFTYLFSVTIIYYKTIRQICMLFFLNDHDFLENYSFKTHGYSPPLIFMTI